MYMCTFFCFALRRADELVDGKQSAPQDKVSCLFRGLVIIFLPAKNPLSRAPGAAAVSEHPLGFISRERCGLGVKIRVFLG